MNKQSIRIGEFTITITEPGKLEITHVLGESMQVEEKDFAETVELFT